MPFQIKPKANEPSTQEIKTEVRAAIAQAAEDESVILSHKTPEVTYDEPSREGVPDRASNGDYSQSTGVIDDDSITDVDRKLERLTANDFPFDESQLAAVDGLVKSQYGCLTGAAGTGKTTTTQKLVDTLLDTTHIGSVDMRQYWAKSDEERQEAYDEGDDYEYDESHPVIPTILMCSFTGRATQQIKRNFPRSWHGNIMTIHRALGFMPTYEPVWDPEFYDKDTGEVGGYRQKMKFVPTYTADCKMPWDIIIIDEAGMLGLDLWHQLLDATKDGARIYMVGDINQLPPVHGRPIFGFALAKWPAFELTHVHRQQGKNNPIVDNAWRIIHGQMPQSEGRFQMQEITGDAQLASRKVRAMVANKEKGLVAKGIYDPIRDTIITPINGELGSRGFALGQIPLNAEFALMFNPKSEHPRYIIDGGREKKQFAVGDKVMATRNDWEAGITNGMTGIITSIAENGAYSGDRMRYGILEEVNAMFANSDEEDDGVVMSLEDLDSMVDSMEDKAKGREQAKEKRERGPSSHVVTVRFGSEEHGFEIPFQTLAEVGSLMTAYVVTCHKMQGGESPTVVIICHDAHRHMLYREWLYTAVTRASERCILLYTRDALSAALTKQKIKGRTLKEKVVSFNALIEDQGRKEADRLFDWNKEVRLPYCESTALTVMDRSDDEQVITPARLTTDAERQGGVAALLKKVKERQAPTQEVHVHVHVEKVEVKNIFRKATQMPKPPTERVVDGGDLKPESPKVEPSMSLPAPTLALPKPTPQPKCVSQYGAVKTLMELRNSTRLMRLPYYPKVSESAENSILLDGPLEQATQIVNRREANQQMVATTIKTAPAMASEKPKGINFLLARRMKKESE